MHICFIPLFFISPEVIMNTKKDDDEDYTCKSTFSSKRKRLSASLINQEDLDALGIFYEKSSTAMPNFLNMLQERKSRIDFPDVAKSFIELTNTNLKFTLDLDKIPSIDVESGPAIEEREIIENLDEESRDLERVRLKEMSKLNPAEDTLKIVLFTEWISSTKKFIELTQEMVQLLIFCKTKKHDELGEKNNEITENIYCDVFARFTEIFFLLPLTGRRTSIWNNDKIVGSVSDIIYHQYIPRGAPNPVLSLFFEVKNVPSQKSDDACEHTWISQKLDKKVMDQVGLELVSECFRSAFLPNVLGVICMRTEVIFVYLSIATEHVKAIRNNEDIEGKKASIHYTQAFDIMKREDRIQISELLFWLGCVQKYNLQRYYLKQ